MIQLLLNAAAAGLFFAFVSIVLGFNLSIRGTSNKLMAISSKQFHDSTSKLLSADADELPREVLAALDSMMYGIEDRWGHFRMLLAFRAARKSRRIGANNSVMKSAVQSMRPELQTLFFDALTGWLNFQANRNFFVSIGIALEFRKSEAAAGRILHEEDTASTSFFQAINKAHC